MVVRNPQEWKVDLGEARAPRDERWKGGDGEGGDSYPNKVR